MESQCHPHQRDLQKRSFHEKRRKMKPPFFFFFLGKNTPRRKRREKREETTRENRVDFFSALFFQNFDGPPCPLVYQLGILCSWIVPIINKRAAPDSREAEFLAKE